MNYHSIERIESDAETHIRTQFTEGSELPVYLLVNQCVSLQICIIDESDSLKYYLIAIWKSTNFPRPVMNRHPEPSPSLDLAALRQFDTPTICNAIELFGIRPASSGYMDRRIAACFSDLPPMVGYAACP
jgi:hypothetical protein